MKDIDILLLLGHHLFFDKLSQVNNITSVIVYYVKLCIDIFPILSRYLLFE